ncbi:MAG: hypothetical protein DRI84_06375 [Bacteroidetes bacterium]|nr:MAG: hypothetical protein DRI84_06375 [Bacteroidota bacterium]
MSLIDTVFLKNSEIEIHHEQNNCVIMVGPTVIKINKYDVEALITHLTKAQKNIKTFEIDQEQKNAK